MQNTSPQEKAKQAQNALEYMKKILAGRAEVEERIEMLMRFKKEIQSAKATVQANLKKNEDVLENFKDLITKKVKTVRESTLQRTETGDNDENSEKVKMVNNRIERIAKEVDEIGTDRDEIDYYISCDNEKTPEQRNIQIIKLKYIQSNTTRRNYLNKVKDEEKERNITSREFNISLGKPYSLDSTFISRKAGKTIELTP